MKSWSFQEFCGVASGWAMPADVDRAEAVELAGGEGFARSVAAGALAQGLVWSGQGRWPEQVLRDMADCVDDAQFAQDVAYAVLRAKQRSTAAWAASGL